MDRQPRVQVVLGEAERTDGLLRFVLEAEGFDIVGLASDDEELARVLRGARPAVVVLDGGISVAAALEARRRSHGAALVVVWPDGVSAVIAEERVDPYEAIADLGDAVRRAVRRTGLDEELERREPLILIPDAPDVAPTIVRPGSESHPEDRPEPARPRGRATHVLVAAATWLLVLTALTTIAMAVPNALDLFPGRGGARPSGIGSVHRQPSDPRPEDKIAVHERTGDSRGSATCNATTARNERAGRSSGRAHADAVHARACHADHGQNKAPKKEKETGRPDDPGGKANEKQKSRGDRGGDGSPNADGTTVEKENGGGSGGGSGAGSGGTGKVKERPRPGNGGRGEHGKAG